MDSSGLGELESEVEDYWIGFVDLLGYKAIVLGDEQDRVKQQRLHSIYSALIQAIEDIKYDQDSGDTYGGDKVEYIHFSDCFYFSSRSAFSLGYVMSSLFNSCFALYDHTYQSSANEWIPFLRGGIERGWTMMFRDPTVVTDPGREFRNPVGPGIAKAYMVGEKQGVEGMRIVATQVFVDAYHREIEGLDGVHRHVATKLQPLELGLAKEVDRVHLGDVLYEVPWPRLTDLAVSSIMNFNLARDRQFNEASMKHWLATRDLVRQSLETLEAGHLIRLLDD